MLHDPISTVSGYGQSTIKGGHEVDRLVLLIVGFASEGVQTR
jgi:hypothetical protein